MSKLDKNLDGILESEAFLNAKNKAREYHKDPEKIKNLLKGAKEKLDDMEKKKGPIGELIANITTLYRMLKAYYKKEYREIPTESLIWILIAIIYFISPVDFLPDFIPGIGYLDDAFVVALVMKSIKRDLENFQIWEAAQEQHEVAADTE